MSDLMRREPAAPPAVYERPENIWLDEYLEGKESRYYELLLKRKWVVLSITLAALAAAAVWTWTTKPLYKSTVRIQIDPQQHILPYRQVNVFDVSVNPNYLETQTEVLKSEALARRVVRQLNPATPSEDLSRAARGFLGRLEVSFIPHTEVVVASYLSEYPQLAAKAANMLATEYLEFSFDNQRDAAIEARNYIEKELLALKPRLEGSEEAWVKFARDHNMLLPPDEKSNVVLQKLTDLNQEMTRVETHVLANQYEVVRDGSQGEFPESLKTSIMKDLERRLSALQEKRSDMALAFGPRWPDLIALDEQIGDVKQQLALERKKSLEQVKLEYDLARAHRDRVATALATQTRVADALSQDSIRYNALKREVETDRQLRDGLLQRLKETSVAAGLRPANIHVIDRGQVPLKPVVPNVPRNLGLGLVLGMVTGVMTAVFWEFLDKTVKTSEDVEHELGLPFLAVIPAFEKSWKKATGGLLVQASGSGEQLALAPRTKLGAHAYWEGYRSLRTSLLLSSAEKPPQTILVTSAVLNEGKSTTTVNLGISLAQTGARTLLLELDMRRPKLAAMFHLPKGKGISRYLSGQSELNTEILETGIPNLFLVPAGPIMPNPAELIGSRRMEVSLELLARYFDHIVIDSPPLMAVTDALVISPQVDGVLLVVQRGKTSKVVVQKARNLLRSVGARILGVLVTRAKKTDSGYYYQHTEAYATAGDSDSVVT